MTDLNPHSPQVQRAIGQIILAINNDPAFYEAFLEDWQGAMRSLAVDDDVREALIANMARSGLSAFEMAALMRKDGTAMTTVRDLFRGEGDEAGWD